MGDRSGMRAVLILGATAVAVGMIALGLFLPHRGAMEAGGLEPVAGPQPPASPVEGSASQPTLHDLAAAGMADALHRLLREGGADLERGDPGHDPTRSGLTPLMLAARYGNIETLAVLLQAGAQVETRGPEGETALVHAVASGDRLRVEALLDAGADARLADDLGRTPLMLAAERAPLDVVLRLLDAGADATARDAQGQSASDRALKRTDPAGPQVVSAILEAAGE
jgi:hypothetical protein